MIVLAIGVDNMFFITGARDRVSNEFNAEKEQGKDVSRYTNEEQIGMALGEVGPSITTAAIGEFLSFLVGYLTDIPALQSFCLCASFAVLINYFLQMTLFVAFISLDDKRINARRYDLFPCFTNTNQNAGQHYEGKKCLQNFALRYYDFLVKTPVIIIVLLIYVGMTAVSVYAVFDFPLGLNQQTTVTQDGDLFNYFKTQEKYVDVGSPGYLVFYNIDYNNKDNLDLIDEMSDHLSTLSTFLTDIEIAYAESNIPSPFFRMGRSYIVNTEYVASVNILKGVLAFESEIIKPIKSYQSNLRSLRDFMVEKYKSYIHK